MFVSSLEMFWIAIGYGVAAGIVAMILPYRRGLRGIAVNLSLGIVGAVVGGLMVHALEVHYHFHVSSGFAVRAGVAVFTLAIFHILWLRTNPRRSR